MLPYQMESYLYWQREQAEMRQDCREIEKTRMKAEVTENIRIRGQEARCLIKEAAAERKRCIYEIMEIASNGDIQEVTKNLAVPTIPRKVTNMRFPKVIVFVRQNKPQDQIVCLTCVIERRKASIYLKKTQVVNANYLLRRLTAEGVILYKSTPKAKKRLCDLLAALISQAEQSEVATCPGWIRENGKFRFVEEEELTWEVVEGALQW